MSHQVSWFKLVCFFSRRDVEKQRQCLGTGGRRSRRTDETSRDACCATQLTTGEDSWGRPGLLHAVAVQDSDLEARVGLSLDASVGGGRRRMASHPPTADPGACINRTNRRPAVAPWSQTRCFGLVSATSSKMSLCSIIIHANRGEAQANPAMVAHE